jgi:hypothetical protein
VDAITTEFLSSIDLDKIPDIISEDIEPFDYHIIKTSDGMRYKKEHGFFPRANSCGVFNPSYGGKQYAIAKKGREIIFFNGVWFQF